MTDSLKTIAALLTLAAAACAVEDEISVAGTSRAVASENRLSLNRLSLNRLSLNRLSLNRLSLNRLSLNRLSLNGLASDGLETTEEGRELLTYVARCALQAHDTLVAEVDGVTYEFPGALGLSPMWESRALIEQEAQQVSACLLAHVNAFGVSVPISLGTPQLGRASGERELFAVYEAGFFGNLLDDEPLMFACTGTAADTAHAQSSFRALRVCSDPISGDDDASQCSDGGDIPFYTVGDCADVCDVSVEGVGWRDCAAGGGVYAHPVSSWLINDGDDGEDDRDDDAAGEDDRARSEVGRAKARRGHRRDRGRHHGGGAGEVR
jgi:hypothetical protein